MKHRSKMRSHFVICVDNNGYEVSLEKRKLYLALKDKKAEARHLLRVIDESGEDYLYPENFFSPITLPKAIERSISCSL